MLAQSPSATPHAASARADPGTGRQAGSGGHSFLLFQAEFLRDGPTPSLIIRVNTQLTGWLRSHIYRTDRSMADFLTGKKP